jgi:hypothetical protein
MKQFVKEGSLLAIGFLIILALLSLMAPAQTIDNPKVSVTFNGDRASVTIKNATANFAIGELVDAVTTKDFVVDGDYSYASIYTGNPEITGLKTIWYINKDASGYTLGFCDDAAGELAQPFSSLTDAKKEMKKIMRDYYATYHTLDPMPVSKAER